MTREEIITALRCCAKGLLSECPNCKMYYEANCIVKLKTAAADLIENQQRHIEALMQANAALRDTVLRRDGQIEKLAADRKALVNELCQYCGKYKQAHKGACDRCRWKQ